MPISIQESAIEGGTFEVRVDWEDEQGNAVTPDTMAWTLHDEDNSVINNRSSVSIAAPASTELLLLQGSDLLIPGKQAVKRYVSFVGTYTSPVHGAGLPLIDQVDFMIEPRRFATP